jgi:hypothetical protein
MKRLIATLFIALFVISLPLSAQADSARLAALEGEVAAFLNPGYRSALSEGGGYGAIISYYTHVSGEWWTGLVVYNSANVTNAITVGCLDPSGEVAAAGTLSLNPSEFQSKLLSDFMTSGTIPDTGSIVVLGSDPFIVDRYLGNAIGGGFGEVQLEAEYY